jgi:hypothetical protein
MYHDAVNGATFGVVRQILWLCSRHVPRQQPYVGLWWQMRGRAAPSKNEWATGGPPVAESVGHRWQPLVASRWIWKSVPNIAHAQGTTLLLIPKVAERTKSFDEINNDDVDDDDGSTQCNHKWEKVNRSNYPMHMIEPVRMGTTHAGPLHVIRRSL